MGFPPPAVIRLKRALSLHRYPSGRARRASGRLARSRTINTSEPFQWCQFRPGLERAAVQRPTHSRPTLRCGTVAPFRPPGIPVMLMCSRVVPRPDAVGVIGSLPKVFHNCGKNCGNSGPSHISTVNEPEILRLPDETKVRIAGPASLPGLRIVKNPLPMGRPEAKVWNRPVFRPIERVSRRSV